MYGEKIKRKQPVSLKTDVCFVEELEMLTWTVCIEHIFAYLVVLFVQICHG